MAGSASRLLEVAYSQVGITSGKKYWDWYFGGNWAYVDSVRTPWCATFVSWCLAKADVECPGFPRAVAIDVRDDFSGRMVGAYDLKPGDPVGFDWDGDAGGDHVGIVGKVLGNGVYETVEGNTGNGVVAVRTRYASQITCGVRPYFSDAVETGKLDVDGLCGYDTTMEWQRQMGTRDDGEISGQTSVDRRYRPNVLTCVVEPGGSQLVASVQRACQVDDDGLWGPKTSEAIQRRLARMGYYKDNIDSIFGHHSVQALQESLNAKKWKQ